MKRKREYKRGYPVAILTGLEGDQAVMWKVFSNVVKPEKTITLEGARNDSKAMYNFHESIVNALRPTLEEGVRSIVLLSPSKTNYTQKFIGHIREHHTWLVQGPNKATFTEASGSAGTLTAVAALTKTPMFRRLISKTISEEAEDLRDLLEKRLNASDQSTVVLYSLKETEDLIFDPQKPNRPKPEYLMLTDQYLANNHEKNRIYRLMQIAANRKVKTRIVDAKSTAGLRLAQLGGMVCFAKHE